MERMVAICRDKQTGVLIMHPFGTFKGTSGHVSTYPYKRLSADSSPELIGHTVIELLKQSGPTGYHFRDVESYRAKNADNASLQIQREIMARTKTPAAEARHFVNLTVSIRHGQKSWHITRYKYDAKERAGVPDIETRLKVTEEVTALGRLLVDFISQAET
jgi:hypothetical protein